MNTREDEGLLDDLSEGLIDAAYSIVIAILIVVPLLVLFG